MNLTSEHVTALNWFQQRAGHTLTWLELQSGPCVLTISAKGINCVFQSKPTSHSSSKPANHFRSMAASDSDPQ